jgi:ubiquinone/menaquinone biosynthesis C-methylase UbiE
MTGLAPTEEVLSMSRIADLFDALADTYDAVGVDFFRPIAEGLVREVDPSPGQRVLDVGCGRGAALVPLARAVTESGTAVGIDVSPRMVALARDALEAAGVAAEVRVADASAPGLPEGSFDAIVSSLVLFFLPDPAAALRTWRTLLVDGGSIGVATFGAHDDRWRDSVDAVLQRFAAPGSFDARTTGAQGPFASDEGMEALMRSTGFRSVRTVTAIVTPRFDDADHWRRFSMSVGQRQFWMSIPPDQLDEVTSTVFAAVDECRDDEGRIGFDQEVRYTLALR